MYLKRILCIIFSLLFVCVSTQFFSFLGARDVEILDPEYPLESLEEEPIPEPEVEPEPVEEPEPEVTEEDLGVDFEFPVIGTVVLYPFKEAPKKPGEKTIRGYRVKYPRGKEPAEFGPLIIESGEFRIVGDKLAYSAQATLFGARVTVGIKEVVKIPLDPAQPKVTRYRRVRFGIDFPAGKEPSFELLPQKEVKITSADLVVEQGKPAQIIATTTLFNQNIEIDFVTSKEGTRIHATLKETALSNLIPQVKDTSLADAKIKKLDLTIQTSKASEKAQQTENPATLPGRLIELQGTIDVSSVQALKGAQNLRDSQLQGRIDSTGTLLTIDVPKLPIQIPSATGASTTVDIEHAKLVADFRKDKKQVQLEGLTHLDLPQVGKLDITVSAALSRKGIEFSGEVKQPIKFAGIDIRNGKVTISTEKKQLEILGDATIRDNAVKIVLSKGAAGDLVAEASLIGVQELRPFSPFGIPILSDIALKNPKFKFERTKQGTELFTIGSVSIFGMTLNGELRVKKQTGASDVILLIIKAPEKFKLSSVVPFSFLDDIELHDLYFILSSQDYNDTERNAKFKKGINFYAKAALTGALAPVATLTESDASSEVTLVGYFGSNPLDSVFSAQIPGGINLKSDSVKMGKLLLEIAGNPTPKISLLTTIEVKTGEDTEPLLFTARIGIEPTQARIAGTMEGFWEKPFGIKGIQIGNLALESGISYTVPPIPSMLGFAGTMCIGGRPVLGVRCGKDDKSVCTDGVAVCVGIKVPVTQIYEMVLAGELSKLTIADVVKLATSMIGQSISTDAFPPIGFEKVKIYIVPKTTKIGELDFERGLNLSGKLMIPGFDAVVAARVSDTAILAQGYCSKIAWGPLHITGAGPTGGPIISFELSSKKQEFLVSGRFALEPKIFEAEGQMHLTAKGSTFHLLTALGKALYNGKPLLLCSLDATSALLVANPEFTVEAIFLNNLQQYLKDQIDKGIGPAKQQVTETLNSAKNAVQTLETTSKQAEAKIDEAERAVAQAQDALKAIDDAISEADQVLNEKKKEVQSLDNQIKDLNKKISDAKDEFDRRPWYEKTVRWVDFTAQATYWGTQIAGLYVAKGVAEGTLEIAKGISTVTLQAAKQPAYAALEAAKQFLERIGKNVSKATLALARETSKNFLEGLKQATSGALDVASFVSKTMLSAVDVRQIRYYGSLQELSKGVLGDVLFDIKLLDSIDASMHAKLDISDPIGTLKSVIDSSVGKLATGLFSLKEVQNANKVITYQHKFDEVATAQLAHIDAELAQARAGLGAIESIKNLESRREELIKRAQQTMQTRVNDDIKKDKFRDNERLAKNLSDLLEKNCKDGTYGPGWNKQRCEETKKKLDNYYKTLSESLAKTVAEGTQQVQKSAKLALAALV